MLTIRSRNRTMTSWLLLGDNKGTFPQGIRFWYRSSMATAFQGCDRNRTGSPASTHTLHVNFERRVGSTKNTIPNAQRPHISIGTPAHFKEMSPYTFSKNSRISRFPLQNWRPRFSVARWQATKRFMRRKNPVENVDVSFRAQNHCTQHPVGEKAPCLLFGLLIILSRSSWPNEHLAVACSALCMWIQRKHLFDVLIATQPSRHQDRIMHFWNDWTQLAIKSVLPRPTSHAAQPASLADASLWKSLGKSSILHHLFNQHKQLKGLLSYLALRCKLTGWHEILGNIERPSSFALVPESWHRMASAPSVGAAAFRVQLFPKEPAFELVKLKHNLRSVKNIRSKERWKLPQL